MLARKLGCALLTRTMKRRHQIGLDSYDRFFPNQDTMPRGGFGNLIALPLQRTSRDEGNSVFLDERLEPFADQWRYLSSIRRLTYGQAESVVNDAQLKGDLVGVRFSVAEDDEAPDPWTLPPSRKRPERLVPGPFPKSVEIVRAKSRFHTEGGVAAGDAECSPSASRVSKPRVLQSTIDAAIDVRQASRHRLR
jgi:hypothetical protein